MERAVITALFLIQRTFMNDRVILADRLLPVMGNHNSLTDSEEWFGLWPYALPISISRNRKRDSNSIQGAAVASDGFVRMIK